MSTTGITFSRAPTVELERTVAAELASFRSRLLRRADIARRRAVLDLGAGHGVVARELARRCDGKVTALDPHPAPTEIQTNVEIEWVQSIAPPLPFPHSSFDLVFAQHFFLWTDAGALPEMLHACRQVLMPGGVLVALEPDYTGMLEQPEAIAIADIWREALARAGACVDIGSRLVFALRLAGWDVEVELPSRCSPVDPARYDRLAGLALTEAEQTKLHIAAEAHRAHVANAFVFLPYLAIVARPPGG